jgi:hypothetical protein
VLLTTAAGIVVWKLYPALPDPVIMRDGNKMPLILHVGGIFFVQFFVIFTHFLIPKVFKLPPWFKENLIYFDIFFVLFTLFWLGLTLMDLLEYLEYYVRGMYFWTVTIALFSGYFSCLGSRVKEFLMRGDKDNETRAEQIKVIGFAGKVFGVLAWFSCLAFFFPDWRDTYIIIGALLVLTAMIPIQGMRIRGK